MINKTKDGEFDSRTPDFYFYLYEVKDMYSISHIEFYKLYDASVDKIINYFYSKDELIKFIARWYRTNEWVDGYHKNISNSFIEHCTCNINELFKNNENQYYRCYILYDNFDRIINIHDFESDALKLYQNWEAEGKTNTYSWFSLAWRWRRYRLKPSKYEFLRKMDSNYRYRKDPVPHTRKQRGGSSQSPPHTAKIMRMYANPDYKYFNRGSAKEIPQWWDDRHREIQKSWKEQSKARHQWQRKKV